jgi:nucleotide-binding universal stress UspA family protein
MVSIWHRQASGRLGQPVSAVRHRLVRSNDSVVGPKDTVGDGPWLVIVAVDGSLTALRAVSYAAGLARRNRAVLVLAHVRQPLAAMSFALAGADPQLFIDDDNSVRWLDELSTQSRQEFGVAAESVVRQGEPAREIARLAEERRADVIVVGRSQSVMHRFVGSLAARLCSRVVCPVIVVP